MSLSEPLAWPFREEQLEAIASRIRAWNSAVPAAAPLHPPEPPSEPAWAGAAAPELSAPGSQLPEEPVQADGDGQQGAEPPFTDEPGSIAASVSYDAESRSVSFEGMADSWEMDAPAQTEPAAAHEPAPFVPAFERDEEDDSELDIRPEDRALVKPEGDSGDGENP